MPKKNIFVFKNSDKDGRHKETWTSTPNRGKLNFPAPYRMILLGSPSSGKSNFMKNVIIEANPKFKEFYLIHFDKDSKEWDMIDWHYKSNVLPDPSMFHGKVKKLLVIEDLELRSLDKDQLKRLSRIFGYSSSHHNTSIMLSQQDGLSCPVGARRCASVIYLTSTPDINAVSILASRAGYKATDMQYLYSKYIKGQYDSLCIDLTPSSPYPLRHNGYTPIDYNKETSSEN